jgi:cardiolipin synthase (CMP-forming)
MARSHFFGSVPNIITVGRLVLVPVVVALISSQRWPLAFAVFFLAGLSDGVDGFIARRFNLRTELGAHLDPVADKALLMSIYVALAVDGVLPSQISILVVSRDVMILGAVVISWVLAKPVEIRPLLVSKANTLMQISLAGAVLAARAFGWSLDVWLDAMLWVVAALTIASMAAYLDQWLRHMSA